MVLLGKILNKTDEVIGGIANKIDDIDGKIANKIDGSIANKIDEIDVKIANKIDGSIANKIDDPIGAIANKTDDAVGNIANQTDIRIKIDDLKNKLSIDNDLKIQNINDIQEIDVLIKQSSKEYDSVIKNIDNNPNLSFSDKKKLKVQFKNQLKEDINTLNSLKKSLLDINTTSEFKDFIKKHWKILSAITIGTITGITIFAIIGERLNSINSTNYRITSIQNYHEGTLIEYTPPHQFSKLDTIRISNSNSIPEINGFFPIYKIAGTGSILIKSKKITQIGTFGDMKVQTTFANQFSKTLDDVINPVAQTLGTTAGQVIGSGLSGVSTGLSSFFSGVFGDFWWIFIAIIVIIILSSLSLFFMYIKKHYF